MTNMERTLAIVEAFSLHASIARKMVREMVIDASSWLWELGSIGSFWAEIEGWMYDREYGYFTPCKNKRRR